MDHASLRKELSWESSSKNGPQFGYINNHHPPKQNFTLSFSLSHTPQKKKLAILQFSSCFVSFTTPNPHNTLCSTHY
ncbi:hypothetical protein glysoja_005233 [Glycine soja]|nr:hypothetical protein glysoja_005233 [Glycine soja]